MFRQSADGRRWVAVGSSCEADAARAGAAAARGALGGDDARLLVVFASDGYELPTLLDGIRAVAPRIPLIGCTTAGEVSSVAAAEGSVVVAAVGGPGVVVSTGAVRGISPDLHGAGTAAAGVVAGADVPDGHDHRVLLVLSDGLAGDQQELVRGLYATLGASVPLVGGSAGDGLRMESTFQLHDDEVLTDAVVVAAIASDAPIAIAVRHGWRPVRGDRGGGHEAHAEPLLVTESGGDRICRFDDRPALDVYLERLDARADAAHDREVFRRFAITHPIGLERRSGMEVRFIADADPTERSLVCTAEVPQGELVHLLEGGPDSVLAATDAACRDIGDALGTAPLGLLAFDCIGRRGVLAGALDAEVARMRRAFPDVPLAGLFTYGEFARVRGARGFHNQTLVLLGLA